MRDTGASQTLISKDVLPFSDRSYTGQNVLVTGIEMGVASVPLHSVYLKSDLWTGVITVGVRDKLSVDGISLMLGNYVCGDKVLPNPIVCNVPLEEDNTEP